MRVSIVIATCGDEKWRDLSWSWAYPSTEKQDAHEVLIHHDPDASVVEARNALGEKATGDWLCFLDADDELGPNYVEAMMEAHRRRDSLEPALYFPTLVRMIKRRRKVARFTDRGQSLQNTNYLPIGTLVQRDLFMQVGGFGNYPWGFEDWSLWAKCWKAGAEIVHVPNAFYLAHVNPNSELRRLWSDRRWQLENHHMVRRELFPELYEGA